jgi:hypothetical protein
MRVEQAAFLLLILSGALALVGGLFWTRLNWRADVPSYGRGTRFLDVTLHPERYAKGRAVRVIRMLNCAGGLGIAGALAILAYKALRDFLPLIAP